LRFLVVEDLLVTDMLLFFVIGLLALVVVLLLVLLKRASRAEDPMLASRLDAFEKVQERTEHTVRDEVALSRGELSKAAREQRQELTEAFKTFGDAVLQRMKEVANFQKVQLDSMTGAITKLQESNEKKLEAIRITVEEKLQSLQNDNAKQLEQMRQTVDEKLQGTLEKRLGESFKQVSDRLEQVHKGLGEMQTLATGVGDLKKVLTNVKTRGTWGEVQLGALLEQVLSPDQFAVNVATKDGGERV
jgi:DNA recombination protein RmuC